jgi:hypothetical protein
LLESAGGYRAAMKCPNCDLALTAAPWRYDDDEHGVHWVCPTDERVETEIVYAPVSITEAIEAYLREHPGRVRRGRIG